MPVSVVCVPRLFPANPNCFAGTNLGKCLRLLLKKDATAAEEHISENSTVDACRLERYRIVVLSDKDKA